MAALQVTLLSLLSETNVRPCKSLPEPLPSSCQRSLAPGQAAQSPRLSDGCAQLREHVSPATGLALCQCCGHRLALAFKFQRLAGGRKWTENAKALRSRLATAAAESTGPRLPTGAPPASSVRIWPGSLSVSNLLPSASLRRGSQRRADGQHGSKLVRWILRKLQSQRVKPNLPSLASSAAQALSASAASCP